MNRQDVINIVKIMRENSELNIRDYARINTPDVPERELNAIIAALDMISVDEAITVLWRIQKGDKSAKITA